MTLAKYAVGLGSILYADAIRSTFGWPTPGPAWWCWVLAFAATCFAVWAEYREENRR